MSDIQIDPSAPGLISEENAKKYCAIPVGFEKGQLVVVMNDPLDFIIIDEIRYITGKDILPKMSTRRQILAAIDGHIALDHGVDLVRRQLGPLHDRGMLVASYERESSRLAALRRLASDPTTPPSPVDPIEAAYALRWLELAPGAAPLPPWSELVGRESRAAG